MLGTGRSFVGRDADLQQLDEAAREAERGSGRMLLIVGETGIGKTALVQEYLRRFRAAGRATAVGGAFGSEMQLPFAPVIEALRSVHGEDQAKAIGELTDEQLASLGRLVPEIPRGTAPATPIADEFAQLRLFEAVVGFLRALGAIGRPALLVLEDLHWVDPSTRALLTYLARYVHTVPLVIAATARQEDVESRTPIRALLLELTRFDAVGLIELAPLPADDVVRVLAAHVRVAPLGDAESIVRRSGGNPLYALELSRTAAAAGRLPSTLRGMAGDRVRALHPPARALVAAAAIHGPRGSVTTLDAVVGRAGGQTDALAAAVEGLVLSVAGDVWRFRQPWLAEVLAAELLPANQRRLHLEWAAALSASASRSPEDRIALARHVLAAGDRARARPALVDAANVAFDMRAYVDAHELFEKALAIDARIPSRRGLGFDAPTAADVATADVASPEATLLATAAQAASYAGRAARAVELAEMALASAEGDPDARLEERLARYMTEAGRPAAALAIQERLAVARGNDGTADAARVMASYAAGLQALGRLPEAEDVGRRAVDAAVAARSIVDEYRGRTVVGACLVARGDAEAGLRELDAALRLADLVTSPSRVGESRVADVLSTLLRAAAGYDLAGRGDSAASVASHGRDVAADLNVRGVWTGRLGDMAAAELFDLGRWTEVDELTSSLIVTGRDNDGRARCLRSRLLTARGDLVGAGHLLASLAATPDAAAATVPVAIAVAELAIARGDLTAARRAIADGLRDLGTSERPEVLELFAAGLGVEAELAELARARGATSELVEIEETANALWARVEATVGALEGPKIRALQTLAHAELERVHNRDQARDWMNALAALTAISSVPRAAYAGYRAAVALIARSRQRAEPERLLRAARATAENLGAVPLLHQIVELGARARLDTESDASEGSSAPEERRPHGLSAREIEVLALLAIGMTNREIAERLFITEKTASHHVSNILMRLDVRGRVEAAAVAIKLGIASSVTPADSS